MLALFCGILSLASQAAGLDYVELQQTRGNDGDFRKQEFIWMKGTALIRAKNVLEGVRLLDSLRVFGFDEKEFLSGYTKEAFHAFIPLKSDTAAITDFEVRRWFGLDSSMASSFRCDISRPVLVQYPCFVYSATFIFKKPFPLVFTGLSPLLFPSALLQFHGVQPQPSAAGVLLDQFNDREEPARCMVCIDLTDTRSSFIQYIGKRINGVYNSIKNSSDLRRYNALSLRCYSYSSFHGEKGNFAAFIVFDRSIRDILKTAGGNGKCPVKDLDRKIRFTLSVQSGIDVETQAEAKLQTLLNAF
jgi:hypothetical protein